MSKINQIEINNTTYDIEDANLSSRVDVIDEVTAAALVDLEERKYEKPENGIPASDLASGVIPSSLPASNTVSSVSSGNNNPVSSGAVYIALDGLKLQRITQSAYDTLDSKDPNILYVITVS